jgi:hypothetical protein
MTTKNSQGMNMKMLSLMSLLLIGVSCGPDLVMPPTVTDAGPVFGSPDQAAHSLGAATSPGTTEPILWGPASECIDAECDKPEEHHSHVADPFGHPGVMGASAPLTPDDHTEMLPPPTEYQYERHDTKIDWEF